MMRVMDVTFVANDTRGGIEPYLALATEAAARGHAVRAVAPPDYADQFTALGAAFRPLLGAERAAITARGGTVRFREMGGLVAELTRAWARDAATFAAGTDIVVAGIGGLSVARPVAERLGVPLLRAHLQPLEAPSGVYPGPLLPRLDFHPLARRLSHRITAGGVQVLTRASERAARDELGLSGRPTSSLPLIIYGFSSAVIPVASDARTRRIATGYWTMPATETTPAKLEKFLDGDHPVVAIGFGSMHGEDSDALRNVVLDASRQVGARTVLISGWGALNASASDGEDVLTIDSVAHSLLFPRVSATVHHGGAGTTGAAFAAGVPTVVVPFLADQPFWASRAHQLGVAPPPIPRRALTSDALATALHIALHDTAMNSRAYELGCVLAKETGARTAIDHVEIALQNDQTSAR